MTARAFRNYRRARLARLAVAAVLLAAGCARMPSRGATPTGEALGISTSSSSHGYLTTEKVGEVQYQDSHGAPAGSASVYRQKAVTYRVLEWQPTQGGAILSDADFFRIAGDAGAAAEIEAHDRNAWIINRTGMVAVLAGLAALVASVPAKNTRLGGIGLTLTTLGGITAYVGKGRLDRDQHVFPIDRARQAADAYNRSLPAPR